MDYLNYGLDFSNLSISESDSNSLVSIQTDELQNIDKSFILVIDVDIDIDGKQYTDKQIELKAIIQEETTIKVGYKAWCVHLEKQENQIVLQNLTYLPICAKDQNMPAGLLGTLPMLKAAIQLAQREFYDINELYLYDNTGFADNRSRDDIPLHTRDMCLYMKTWYQRKLSDKLEPQYENDKAKIESYKKALMQNVSTEYVDIVKDSVKRFRPKIESNIEKFIENNPLLKMTYNALFQSIYEHIGNYVYTLFIVPFTSYYNLPSLHGIPWKMKLSDMTYDGLSINIKEVASHQTAGRRYVEKIKLSKKLIARKAVYLD